MLPEQGSVALASFIFCEKSQSHPCNLLRENDPEILYKSLLTMLALVLNQGEFLLKIT